MTHRVPDAILRLDRNSFSTISEVLQRMRDEPGFEEKARGTVRRLIDLKSSRIGEFAEENILIKRWKRLVKLDIDELEDILLAEGEEGREMRHAHFFAGLVPHVFDPASIRKMETPGGPWYPDDVPD